MFTERTSLGCLILVAYVDDIIIIGSDVTCVQATKDWLHSQLHIKDLGKLQYFLGIVVSRNNNGILLNQNKYIMD